MNFIHNVLRFATLNTYRHPHFQVETAAHFEEGVKGTAGRGEAESGEVVVLKSGTFPGFAATAE